MSAWVVVAACVGFAGALAGAVFLGRRLQAGRQAKATSEAQSRMAGVGNDRDLPSTARRLRDRSF